MSLYLYGVIASDGPLHFGPIGFEGKETATLFEGELAAVVGPSPRADFTGIQREELVRLLLAHQETLETIMKRLFVLPFRFGTVVADDSEVRNILRGGRSTLAGLIHRLGNCHEIDLLATWEVPRVLQEIAEEDPEIAASKAKMAHGGEKGDLTLIGKLLAEALKRRGTEWQKILLDRLAPHVEDAADHDLLNDEMILNRSFLVSREKETLFFQALEEIDLFFRKKLHFKCVGPLPPYSFATVTLTKFNPEAIVEAARILRLNGKAELSLVKNHYKRLSRESHPDTNPHVPLESFEKVTEAYRLLSDYCAEGPRSLQREEISRAFRLSVFRAEEARR